MARSKVLSTPRRRAAPAPAAKSVNGQGAVRTWLETQIANGVLRPGERIDEKYLCERFNVSRTPVREALLQLASLGLVAFRPRQGAVVARMTVKDLIAMWEVLTGLEALAAQLAARRMSPDNRAKLAAAHEAGKQAAAANDVAAYDEANRQLHELIYHSTQNDYLAQQVMDIRRRLQVYRRLPFERPGGLDRSLRGHGEVVEAVLSGNDELAYAAMREHVSGGLTFVDFVAQITQEADANLDDLQAPPAVKASRRRERSAVQWA